MRKRWLFIPLFLLALLVGALGGQLLAILLSNSSQNPGVRL